MDFNELLMLVNSVMLTISGHGTTKPHASSLGRSPIVYMTLNTINCSVLTKSVI